MNKIPIYQKLLVGTIYTISGLLAAGAILGAINDTIQFSSLISWRVTLIISMTLLTFWYAVENHLKKEGIIWVEPKGRRVRLRKLPLKLRLGIIGFISLFWLPIIGGQLTQQKVVYPERPSISNYSETLSEFINSQSNDLEQITNLLAHWGIATPVEFDIESDIVLKADLDNDGVSEIIIATPGDGGEEIHERNPTSQIIVFDINSAGLYQPYMFDLEAQFGYLWHVADINADMRVEIATKSMNCGAHTCVLRVNILHWSAEKGFQELLYSNQESEFSQIPPTIRGIAMPFAKARLENIASSPGMELIIEGGMWGSAGAGLQRPRLETYAWSGEKYILASVQFDPTDSQHPIFRLIDGNAALARSESDIAKAFYQAAIAAFPAPDGSDKDIWAYVGRPPIAIAFARFRIFLILLHENNVEEALRLYNDAQEQDQEYAIWTRTF